MKIAISNATLPWLKYTSVPWGHHRTWHLGVPACGPEFHFSTQRTSGSTRVMLQQSQPPDLLNPVLFVRGPHYAGTVCPSLTFQWKLRCWVSLRTSSIFFYFIYIFLIFFSRSSSRKKKRARTPYILYFPVLPLLIFSLNLEQSLFSWIFTLMPMPELPELMQAVE